MVAFATDNYSLKNQGNKPVYFRLKKNEIAINNETSILRSSFSRFMVNILPGRLRLYAININPTSALARSIPFLVRI